MPQTNIDHLNRKMPTLDKKRSEKMFFPFLLQALERASERAKEKVKRLREEKSFLCRCRFKKSFNFMTRKAPTGEKEAGKALLGTFY